jgi:hypothetical protein
LLRPSTLLASESELVAQSGTGNIDRVSGVKRGRKRGRSEAGEKEIRSRVVVVAAKVVVQPFASQEQVIPQLPFSSRSCNPTEIVAVGRAGYDGTRELSRIQSRMTPANARSAVEQQVGKLSDSRPARARRPVLQS